MPFFSVLSDLWWCQWPSVWPSWQMLSTNSPGSSDCPLRRAESLRLEYIPRDPWDRIPVMVLTPETWDGGQAFIVLTMLPGVAELSHTLDIHFLNNVLSNFQQEIESPEKKNRLWSGSWKIAVTVLREKLIFFFKTGILTPRYSLPKGYIHR